jgi:hypothetical protein
MSVLNTGANVLAKSLEIHEAVQAKMATQPYLRPTIELSSHLSHALTFSQRSLSRGLSSM